MRDKGERLNKKLEQAAAKRFLKQPKTVAVPDHIKKIENSLLAIKIYGQTSVIIPFDAPTDATRLSELELVFNADHEGIGSPNYDQEATELLKRYNAAVKKEKIKALSEKLENLDENNDEYETLIREISDLQKS